MNFDRDQVAALLPAYEIGDEIGRGAWGIVLHGHHRALGRDVAIKQLPRAFGNDPAVRARFVAEARVLASLDHPHIVPVFDYVDRDGVCLLVMEELTGGTVWSHFTKHGLTYEKACAIALATLLALDCAHRRGVLHRDIKPENLLLSRTNVLKVSDFGIATVIGGPETVATRAGEVLGTPAFMAPEQAQGLVLSPATDVYAVGVMLYELLSGQLPFADQGEPLAILYRHVHEQPVPLQKVAQDVPDGVAAAVMRAMAKSVADRFPSAEAFGLTLAEAATRAWGVGWLSRSEFSVMASGPVLAVTERAQEHRPVPEQSGGRMSVVRPTFQAHRLTGVAANSGNVQLLPVTEVAGSIAGHSARAPGAVLDRRSAAEDAAAIELRKAVLSDEGRFQPQEVDELLRLTSYGDLAARCGCPPGSSAAELRNAARSGVETWRTKAASPLADRTRTRICEGAARVYEAIHAEVVTS